MMKHCRTLTAAISLATAACAQPSDRRATIDTDAEKAKLIDASRRWSTLAAEGKNPDAVAAYWAEDAVLMQAGVPTLRGREAARQMVSKAFETPGFSISWEPIEAHVSASGDMGYIIERSRVTEPHGGGKLQTQDMRAVTIWRKDAKGEWRNAVDISNAEMMPN
jgi:ketosteroid isomerase-like protein